MISVDTNLVVRLLTRDEEVQFQKAFRVFEQEEVLLVDTVMLETEWVLRYAYKLSPEEISEGFKKVLGLPNVHTPHPDRLQVALSWFSKEIDFADALHLAHSCHCTEMKTFDKAFISKAKGVSDCRVTAP